MSRPDPQLAACVINGNLQLTSEERQLIANFRAMERCAQQMIVDCAAQYRYTLPAERVRLALVN